MYDIPKGSKKIQKDSTKFTRFYKNPKVDVISIFKGMPHHQIL